MRELPAEIRTALEWWSTLEQGLDKWKQIGMILRGAVAAADHIEQAQARLTTLTEKITAAEARLAEQQEVFARQQASQQAERERQTDRWDQERNAAAKELIGTRAALEAVTADVMQRRQELEQLAGQIRRGEQQLREIEQQVRGLAEDALTHLRQR